MSALTVVLVPATQAQADPKLPFEVTVKGTIGEQWSRATSVEQGDCHARIESSGGSAIRFETPRPQRVRASIDDGWTGNPRLRVTSTRNGTDTITGQERAENGRFFCDPEPETRGGECGTRTATVPLGLSFDSRPFHLEASGEDDLWDAGCLYTPSPLGYDYGSDALGLLERSGLPLKQRYSFWIFGGGDARGHIIRARRTWTFKNAKRITLPYRQSENGPQIGAVTADVQWTVTFRRLGKIRRPPGG